MLQEAIALKPDDLSTHGVNCMLSYYDNPAQSKNLFEASGWLQHWETLELMRNNQFEEAEAAWGSLSGQYSDWRLDFVKYKYLQMKIRQGEYEQAIQVLSEILKRNTSVNYRLFSTDPELDPLRDLDGFKVLMKRYFPEKG